jgi:hypothetical protein
MSQAYAYLAGFIDGEGSITAGGNGPKSVLMRLTLYNNNRKIISWIKQRFGGAEYVRLPKNKKKHAINYMLVWRGKKLIKLLDSVYPFLIGKKKQAKLALEFCRFQHSRTRINSPFSKADIARAKRTNKRMMKLNKRGPACRKLVG